MSTRSEARPDGPPDAAAPGELRQFVADRGDAGVRVDRVLLRRLADVPRLSRARLQRWIDEGRVDVDGRRPPKTSMRVPAGARVLVRLPAMPPRATAQPEARPLSILYDGPDALVVDKPAGVVVHPAYKHAGGTLLNALLWQGRASGATSPPRLVHRLDKQTSGVLLVAKSAAAHAALVGAWRTRAVTKRYLALVIGRPPKRRGEIRLKLDRDPVDRRRVLASATRGKESVTRYEVVMASRGTRAGIALVACELLTGRMHQLRAHLAAVGCPIVADRTYGRVALPATADYRLARIVRDCPRQALHAWQLAAPLPDGARLEVTAPLPADMRAVLEAAGIDADEALHRFERLRS